MTDDFIDETAFLRKNLSKKRQKVQRSQQDSLLTNDDSFVEFCIRNYWWTVLPKVSFFGIIFKP
jgi:hypothetical protein